MMIRTATNYLTITLFCFTRAAWLAVLIVLVFPQELFAEPFHTGTAAAAENRETITEKQSYKKHILVMTSQPYVTEWFSSLNETLRNEMSAFLTPDSKISYE